MQNSRWSAMAALPYGPGWGTNPPGGVASCLTWDATPKSSKWESQSRNCARPRSASATIPAGATRYLLEPNLNYEERPLIQDKFSDNPIAVHYTTQSNQTLTSCDHHPRHGPRGPPRCGAQIRYCDEEPDDLKPACSCSGRNAQNRSRTEIGCERCRFRRYQNGRQQIPKSPGNQKLVQFSPENTGRVIEIVEDAHGRPVTMTVSRPNTPVYGQIMRDPNGKRYEMQRQWTTTYPHTGTESVDAAARDESECRKALTDDVKRLMNIYQAGKADANFHKGMSEKWQSTVVSAGPKGREEILTEREEREKTVAVRRYQRARYPAKHIVDEADSRQMYYQNGYEPHRNLARGNGMTLMERQPFVVHGWKDPTYGRVRAWEAGESSQPNRVKLQIECPANADTVVNLRVRAPGVDYS